MGQQPYFVTTDTGEFAILVGFFVGAIHENSRTSGISHLIEHLKFKSHQDMMNGMRQLGNVNAWTEADITAYHLSTLAADKKLVTQSIDALVHTAFAVPKPSASILAREVAIVKNEMAVQSHSRLSDPSIMSDLLSILNANTPYDRTIIGTEKSLDGITVKDIIEYHEQHYHEPAVVISCPKKMQAWVGGRVSDAIRKYSRISKTMALPIDYGIDKTLSKEHVDRINIMYLQTVTKNPPSFIGIGFGTYAHADPRRIIGDLLAHILHAEYFNTLREKDGNTYGVRCGQVVYKHIGMLGIVFTTRAQKLNDVLLPVFTFLKKLSSTSTSRAASSSGLSTDDLERYKTSFLLSCNYNMTFSEQRAKRVMYDLLYSGDELLQSDTDTINNLTLDTFKRYCHEVLTEQNVAFTATVPVKHKNSLSQKAAAKLIKLLKTVK